MPSKKQYNLVNDDAYDCRIPLYNEEAFQHGITFHAKYIGSMDVPRPTSRVEIVAAMRRIRYEFKAKSVKKKKVSLTVSVEGVKVAIREKKKSNQWPWDENKFVLMNHPIYRIFYVSHDSQDLKIFSYIARDGGANSFKCNVFKSKKKNQAMRIVRTVGQAFEVCHKLSMSLASSSACGVMQDDLECSQLPDSSHKGDGASEPNSCDMQVEEVPTSKAHETGSLSKTPQTVTNSSETGKLQNEPQKPCYSNGRISVPDGNSSNVSYDLQILRDQLEQQNQKIIMVSSQVQLLKDQLANETSNRHQIQAQNEHLFDSNRQLFEQMSKLTKRFSDLEHKCFSSANSNCISPDSNAHPSPQGVLNYNGSDYSPTFSVSKTEPITKNRLNAMQENLDRGKHFGAKYDSPSDYGISNSSFGRQLSASSVTFPISPASPNSALSSNTSLPCSPSMRNMYPDSSNFFSYPSPQSNRPKQTNLNEKMPGDGFPSMSSSFKRDDDAKQSSRHQQSPFQSSSPSGFHNKNAEIPLSFQNSSPMFKRDRAVESGDSMFSSRSTVRSEDWSVNLAPSSDSFIAQVTRDLAKMSSPSFNTEAGTSSKYDSRYTSLFEKS